VVDEVEWHTQIGDMVSRDLIQATVDAGKLQKMVTKLAGEVKQERVINKSRHVKIQYPEDKIVALATDKKDKEVVKIPVKKKDLKIKI
jgi:hypothetical protein